MQAGERMFMVGPSRRLQPSNAVHLPSIVAANDKGKVVALDAKEVMGGLLCQRLITEEIMDSMNLPYLEALFERDKATMKSRALPVHDSSHKKTGTDFMQKARESIQKNRLNINLDPSPTVSRSISTMDIQFRNTQARKTTQRKFSVLQKAHLRPSPPNNPEDDGQIKLKNRKRMHCERVATLERCEEELEQIVRQTKKNLHRNMFVLNNLEAKLMQ